MEFFHFTSLSRGSFDQLVATLQPTILRMPLKNGAGQPSNKHLACRKFKPRDIVAMTLKFLLSRADKKDIHVQFGAILSNFSDCVSIGMCAVIEKLIGHPYSRIFWDQSDVGLTRAADRTSKFLAIPGVVGMLDGLKLPSLAPADWREQNRDYNGWTGDVNRNVILLWDPFGKIVDAGINNPGSFHDSKSTLWCHIYDHIKQLPEGYLVVCDSAFQTTGDLSGKLVKLQSTENATIEHEQALTHLRQCSEWGNSVLTGAFRRLRSPLPTDNIRRATIQWCCILLHNWRTHTCDRNQIKTYFNDLEEDD